jgi:hypothetical protein
MAVKRIGFVDYRLDNYHAEVYLKALRGPLAARGYEVVGVTSLEREVSRQWADERQLPYSGAVEPGTPLRYVPSDAAAREADLRRQDVRS